MGEKGKKSERNRAFESWLRQRNAEISKDISVQKSSKIFDCYKIRKTMSFEKWLKSMDKRIPSKVREVSIQYFVRSNMPRGNNLFLLSKDKSKIILNPSISKNNYLV